MTDHFAGPRGSLIYPRGHVITFGAWQIARVRASRASWAGQFAHEARATYMELPLSQTDDPMATFVLAGDDEPELSGRITLNRSGVDASRFTGAGKLRHGEQLI